MAQSTIAPDRRAERAADAVAQAFVTLRHRFDALTARAADHFASRDWRRGNRDASARLLVYSRQANAAVRSVRESMGNRLRDRALWSDVRARFANRITDRTDHEVAATFFNSVTRRVFGTVGVDRGIEFLGTDLDGRNRGEAPVARASVTSDATELARVLAAFPLKARWRDLRGDADAVRGAIVDELNARGITEAPEVELLTTLFYRNKGAYVVGRVAAGAGIVHVRAPPPARRRWHVRRRGAHDLR